IVLCDKHARACHLVVDYAVGYVPD
ncbi:MAG: hypothetical protein JWN10_941, partial [Solirubrobacterales bacterium]|nr:hypothetical protein [Solirubrobacterales bacterium]